MFRAGLLARALDQAGGTAVALRTDESAAVEGLELRPRLIEGQATNIKVTVPADWPLAEAILRLQGRW
jgi:2-C-methyl-D-erythritol 4-phosphate cytidylyltransferase